jgi:iron(III) transport system permease protein
MAVFGGEEGPLDVHSFAGLVGVMTLHFYPYVFVTTAAALERMDASLEEAARSSGAGTLRVLLTITLPLVSPSVAAGGLLAFVAAAANFGTPALIGGPARIFVLPTRVVAYVSVGSPEGLREGTALAVLLMVLALVALCLSGRLTHGRRAHHRARRQRARPAAHARCPGLLARRSCGSSTRSLRSEGSDVVMSTDRGARAGLSRDSNLNRRGRRGRMRIGESRKVQ